MLVQYRTDQYLIIHIGLRKDGKESVSLKGRHRTCEPSGIMSILAAVSHYVKFLPIRVLFKKKCGFTSPS